MAPSKNNNNKPKLAKLLDKDEDYFTEQSEKVLKEIFKRYDIDNDNCLSDIELDAFAIGCNGKPFDKNSKQEIKDNFDVNDKEYLTIKGFIEMYYMQSISDPQETWKDIEKHGYDRYLNLKQQPQQKITELDNNNNNNNNDTKEQEKPSESTTSETTNENK